MSGGWALKGHLQSKQSEKKKKQEARKTEETAGFTNTKPSHHGSFSWEGQQISSFELQSNSRIERESHLL